MTEGWSYLEFPYEGRQFYADKRKAESIVTNPYIQKVLLAYEDIMGISVYE